VVTAPGLTVPVDKEARVALSRLASDQRGLFSAAQAGEIGINYAQLVRGTASGHLRRVRRGVYAVAGVTPSSWEQILGAALAAGPEAVVSHDSAAMVHRFDYADVTAIELTLPPTVWRRPPGAVVHHHADLAARDLVNRRGVLVTSQCRTLVDMAGRWGPELTEKALDEGLVQRRWTVPEVRECLGRARANVPGRSFLERLLSLHDESPTADSVLEAQVFRALAPLEPFETHFATAVGECLYVIDVAWPDRKVGAEIAGRAHRVVSRSAFDRERRKFTALNAAGWKIAHLTAVMPQAEMLAAVRLLLSCVAPGKARTGKSPKTSRPTGTGA
jgi:very-short-patch-repair endonuclease